MSWSRRRFLQTSSLLAVPMLIPRAGLAASAAPPKNRFLQGNFAPLRQEFTEDQLKVVGRIPQELDGLFLRNGPNPQFDPPRAYHWFEGDGMLHGVRLRDGRATFRNRYIQTEGYLAEKQAGKPLYPSMLEMPDLKKVMAGENPFKNAANTAVVMHAGRCYALYEAGEPYQIKLPELGTVGPARFEGKLQHPVTAHPKVDPLTGEMLGFGYIPVKPLALFSIWNAQGELASTRPITLPWPAMIHDFLITKRYAIFPVAPQTFELKRAFSSGSPWYFDKNRPFKIGLVARDGQSEPRWFEAKTAFVFHFLNAYESGEDIVITGCRYNSFPEVISLDPRAKAAEPTQVQLYQWKLDLKSGQLREAALSDLSCEFPRLNERFIGQPHRYGYLGVEDEDFFQAVAKIDLKTNAITQQKYGAGRHGGEPVFVARPGATDEDDGWLMTFVYDQASEKSELVILDARDLSQPPLARVLLPTRIPYGFHGTWAWAKDFAV